MCLVLALTNTKKIKLSKCLNDIGNTLLAAEDDGFGYAVQGKDGVFGEKTIAKRFRTRLNRPNHIILPIVKRRYSSFGTSSEPAGPAIFHGRTSTNVVSLKDTHPMQIDGWNLIHNGVVGDLGQNYVKQTNNDSEDVLRRLIDGQGKANPMEDIERYLEGYYAFAAIDPQGRLHICRDGVAPLHIAYSSSLETFVIGTTESLVLKASKILDAKVGPIDEIDDETYCIFNGNDLIHCQSFKALGYTSRQASHASKSLHRELPANNDTGGLPFGEYGSGGEIIDVSTQSEAGWQSRSDEDVEGSIMDFINSEKHPDRRSVTEDDYYDYKREIENMDDSYQIYTPDDRPLSLQDFKKMDYVSQESCTILRDDGTVVSPEFYDTPRLRGRHAD